MAQIRKMEVETEIMSSADKFYDIFRRKGHLMPKICPLLIKDVKLVDGDWETVGSVRLWTYNIAKLLDGSENVNKDTIETVDEQSKSISYNVLEGDILNYYKTFKLTIEITATGPKGCRESLVKWTIQFEKQNEDIPNPLECLDFLAAYTKAVDAYLLKA